MNEEIRLPNVSGPFSKVSFERINLGSPTQVKDYLLSEGWKPTEYNKVRNPDGTWRSTSPKLTEDSFDSIEGDTGQLLARRNILTHRRRFISNYEDPENKGLLSYVRDDGRAPAKGILCATPTTRTTHREALCNVPKPGKVYGTELRSLFCVREPDVMLGADLDQIEARITAHYAWQYDDGAYWDVLQSYKDIHQYNADMTGLSRSEAKAFQFAIFYGAKAPKIASIVGCSQSRAQKYIDTFWDSNPGIYKVIKGLEEFYDNYGYIVGLDGRILFVRAKYKLFNILIQAGAGIVWKKWGIVTNNKLRERQVNCKQILAYHDEYAYRCMRYSKEKASSIIESSSLQAGKDLGVRVPITTSVKVGKCWAEVH